MKQHDFTRHSKKSLIELGYFIKQGLNFTPLFKENKLNVLEQIKQELKRRAYA